MRQRATTRVYSFKSKICFAHDNQTHFHRYQRLRSESNLFVKQKIHRIKIPYSLNIFSLSARTTFPRIQQRRHSSDPPRPLSLPARLLYITEIIITARYVAQHHSSLTASTKTTGESLRRNIMEIKTRDLSPRYRQKSDGQDLSRLAAACSETDALYVCPPSPFSRCDTNTYLFTSARLTRGSPPRDVFLLYLLPRVALIQYYPRDRSANVSSRISFIFLSLSLSFTNTLGFSARRAQRVIFRSSRSEVYVLSHARY